MSKKNRVVHSFYSTNEPNLSFYLFELAYILGVSKRTIYRLLKAVGVKPPNKRRKNRKVYLTELLNIVGTSFFKRYIKLLKLSNTVTAVSASHEYSSIPPSQIHLMFKTPFELISSGVLNIQEEDVDDAIFCGLLPAIKINGEIFVHPNYLLYKEINYEK